MAEHNKEKVRLNIGIIIPFLEKYGGAERYLIECVRFWQHKHDITIYSAKIKHELLAEHSVGPEVKLVELTNYFSDEHSHSMLLNIVLLPKIWQSEIGKHDLYHTHLWPTHLIDRHPMVWFPHEPLRVLHDLRFEHSVEDLSSEVGHKIHIYPKYNYDRIGDQFFEAYLNTIDKIDKTTKPELIVANSHYTAHYLQDVYQQPVTDVVYPGVEPNLFVDLPIDRNLFVTISQLWTHKRIRLLIEAIALTDNTQLIVIGSGPDRDHLLSFIERLGLEDRVFIVSGLTNRELSLLLSRTCAFLFSAIREPFGIVVLEAMAAGKPIIAVNQGGYTEVCDESFAFMVSPQPAAFAEKITYLQKNPEIVKKMSAAARQKALEYTWERTAGELENLLIKTHAASVPAGVSDKKTATKKDGALFGIQYYLWYGEGFGSLHWNDNPKSGYVNDKPALGYYGSVKGETIHHHFDLFEEMGLDFVILNLHVDALGANGLEVVGIQYVFDIAKQRNSRLKFAVQIAPYVVDSVDNVVTVVKMIEKLFKDHPNYLTIDEKPILFWFWSGVMDGNKSLVNKLNDTANSFTNIAVSLRLPHAIDERKSSFDFFAGMIPFSPLELASEERWETIWTLAYQSAKDAGMPYRGVTVSPGYDDTHLEDEQRVGNPYRSVSRRDGGTYQKCFQFAAGLKEQPDIVMISTFNEYHENTHIEPTLRHGSTYINMTKEFIQKLRNAWGTHDQQSKNQASSISCV